MGQYTFLKLIIEDHVDVELIDLMFRTHLKNPPDFKGYMDGDITTYIDCDLETKPWALLPDHCEIWKGPNIKVLPNLARIGYVFSKLPSHHLNFKGMVGRGVILKGRLYTFKDLVYAPSRGEQVMSLEDAEDGSIEIINPETNQWRLALTEQYRDYITRKNSLYAKNNSSKASASR